MKNIDANRARTNIYKLIDDVNESNEPIKITGERANAVIISEANWIAIKETLYLISIPGMRESIRDGLYTSIDECSEKLDW